jgi:predicted DNA-binding transcriptional regulator YafY
MAKAETPSRTERLMNLMAELLYTERPLTAAELWQRISGYRQIDNLAAFRRAFERDKVFLRDTGQALVVEQVATDDGPVDGYRMDRKRYYLKVPPLSTEELAALRLALLVVDGDDQTGADGLLRLGGLVEPRSVDGVVPVDDDGPAPLAGVDDATDVAQLTEAQASKCAVTFVYNGAERTVDPLRLDRSGGHWQLAAFDRLRDEVRRFRVDRIEGGIVVGAPGSSSPPPDAVATAPEPAWRFTEDPEVTVKLLVDADLASWAITHTAGHAEVGRQVDGSVVLTMAVTSVNGLRWFMLDMLHHCELLEPQELRNDFVAWLDGLR